MAVALVACTARLEETDGPEIEKSLSVLDAKHEAIAAFDVLMDARQPLRIGRACDVEGGPPWGREAVDELVDQARADLLERALRAPSPEGRLYAAMGLYRLKKRAWTDVQALAANEGDVWVCNGCETDRVPAREVIGSAPPTEP